MLVFEAAISGGGGGGGARELRGVSLQVGFETQIVGTE